MVDTNMNGATLDQFLIRKQTFIVKNEHNIDEVYKRAKKVSVSQELCPAVGPTITTCDSLLTPRASVGHGQRHLRRGLSRHSSIKWPEEGHQDDPTVEDQELGALPVRSQDPPAARSPERDQALRVLRGQRQRLPHLRVSDKLGPLKDHTGHEALKTCS